VSVPYAKHCRRDLVQRAPTSCRGAGGLFLRERQFTRLGASRGAFCARAISMT
jgi:hypothetical protein